MLLFVYFFSSSFFLFPHLFWFRFFNIILVFVETRSLCSLHPPNYSLFYFFFLLLLVSSPSKL